MSPARTPNAEQFGFDPDRVKPCIRPVENPEGQFDPTDLVEPRHAPVRSDDVREDTSRGTMGAVRHPGQIWNTKNFHHVSRSNHPAGRVSRCHWKCVLRSPAYTLAR